MFSALFTPKLSEWNNLIENLLLQAKTTHVNIHHHAGRGNTFSPATDPLMKFLTDELPQEK